MTIENMISKIEMSIHSSVVFEELGIDEYLLHTGFTYPDGDELHIVLTLKDGGMVLSDEGHTMMWLSYEDFNMTDTRKRLFDKIIEQNNVEYDAGRISVLFTQAENAGQAAYSISQAILQIADLRYLDRSNVASSFLDDMKTEILKTDLKDQCEFDKKIQLDNMEICEPDVYIDSKNPMLIFGVSSADRAKKTLIDVMNLKENQRLEFRVIVVIDDSVRISQKETKMLINRADKPVFGTKELPEVITRCASLYT